MRGPRFPDRRTRRTRALFLVVVAVGLLWQAWSPAWPAESQNGGPPSSPPGQSKGRGPGGPPAGEEPPPSPEPSPQPEPSPSPQPEPSPQPSPKPGPDEDPNPGDPGTPAPGGTQGGGDDASGQKASSSGTSPRREGSRRGGGPTGCGGSLQLEARGLDLGPPRDTSRLVEILSPLEGRGISLAQALRRVAGAFPIGGEASWSNDWHAARCNPTAHLHKGIDIFAEHGTPLVAAAPGIVTQHGVGAVSGLHVEITDKHGVQYFYGHLSGFAPNLEVGQRVWKGDLLGFVGTTGNARGTSPHVHLEIQPGGVSVPPKPFIDLWLERAENRARKWVRAVLSRPTTAEPEQEDEQPTRGRGAGQARP